MNRLCIFVFYDREGIVDKSVLYLLDEIVKNVNDLYIVCNGLVNDESKKKLERYTSKIYVRDNNGFDAGAYRTAIIEYIPRSILYKYDELILMNDTVFGPFIPMKTIMQSMENRKCDFWGMTSHPPRGDIKEHVQSYFLVIRNKLIRDERFINFWEEIGAINTFNKAVANFEVKFTSYFQSIGYKWDTYVDFSDYVDNGNSIGNYNKNYYDSNDSIKYHNNPFLKKKDFGVKFFACSQLLDSMRYIKDNYNYNTDFIWETVLRRFSVEELLDRVPLFDIISEYEREREEEIGISSEIGLVFYISSTYYLRRYKEHLKQLNRITNIILLVDENIQEDINHIQEELIEAKKRVVAITIDSLFSKSTIEKCESLAQEYKYIVFMRDIPVISNGQYMVFHNYIMDEQWSNCLGSNILIDNIITRLESDGRLGILTSKKRYHLPYVNEEKIFTDILDFNDRFVIDKNQISKILCTCYWCRAEIWMQYLKTMEEFNNELVDVNEYAKQYFFARLIPYITVQEGYYPLTISNKKNAIALLTDTEDASYDRSKDLYDFLQVASINKFSANKGIYIYGTGKLAEEIYKLLVFYKIENIVNGFIVSDKRNFKNIIDDNLQVYELDECVNKNINVLVALNEKNAAEVKYNLDSHGFKSVFYLRKPLVTDYHYDYIKYDKNGKKIAFIIPEPMANAGGTRTILRLIRKTSRCGNQVAVYVMPTANRFKSGVELAKFIKDNYFDIQSSVYWNKDEIDECDAVIATFWLTAYFVKKNYNKARFHGYIIQDYEPYFYPMGAQYLKAYNSYKLGLTPITYGPKVAHIIKDHFEIKDGIYLDFSIEPSVYYDNKSDRSKTVCFLGKPDADRRCYELGVETLKRLYELRPDISIMIYGASKECYGDLPFKYENKGMMSTTDLGDMYRTSRVGLCFSTTNPSLIPYEMMKCGLPVVDIDFNENEYNYGCKDNVILSEPNPETIANDIIRLIDDDILWQQQSKKGKEFVEPMPTDEELENRFVKELISRLE